MHQERRATETPFEEVLMLVSQRVLCVVSAFFFLTASSAALASEKNMGFSDDSADDGQQAHLISVRMLSPYV
jgi:hypothetical protein